MPCGAYQSLCYAESENWPPFIHIQECLTQRNAMVTLTHPDILSKLKVLLLAHMEEIYEELQLKNSESQLP